jgi:hypothetical protein
MTDPLTVASILGFFAKKVMDSLIAKGTGELSTAIWAQFQEDELEKAFKEAVGNAVQRYMTSGTRFSISRPLLEQDGLFAKQVVADELAHLLQFDREPNYELVGSVWKSAVEDPPQWRNFTLEAELLIKYLREELMSSDVFGGIFQRKSLVSITENTKFSADTLQTIDQKLAELYELMDSRFGDLLRAFSSATTEIVNQIQDFTWYIQEKTTNFVGRQFVFDKAAEFMEKYPRGYFIIRGDPGIGKTALLARYVKKEGSIHHFNIRSLGINRTDSFLRNVCAQIIATYHLDYASVPEEAIQDAGFLMHLLNEVSMRLNPGAKVVILIDALDEVDGSRTPSTNPLCLPTILPKGVYILATSRKMDLSFRIECEHETIVIEQNNQQNLNDVKEFISKQSNQSGIQEYLSAQNMKPEAFIEFLTDRSQGNFMYLRYVLPEIERGVYNDLTLHDLPEGLMNYYESHWQRMKGENENAWFGYKLPVIVALTAVKAPVSIDLIAEFSKIQERSRIRSVLRDWQQFLYEEQVQYEDRLQKRYRLYHASFHDFVASKEDVVDEQVDLKAVHAQIAGKLWDELFSDG